MPTPEEIDKINKRIYGETYALAQVSFKDLKESDFFKKLVKIRMNLIRCYGSEKKVLDVGCSTGDYLLEAKDIIREGVGIDYTQKYIDEAIAKRDNLHVKHIEFVQAAAKKIPYVDNSFDLIFSFSTLAYITDVDKVVQEVERVLKKDAAAILEFANLWSLNTVVCKAYPDIARHCHRSISDLKKIIAQAGLEIIDWRSFQILPYWGRRPWWLRPLLCSFWKSLMEKQAGHKMVDEWISSMPLLRNFSFRQIIVCQKKR